MTDTPSALTDTNSALTDTNREQTRPDTARRLPVVAAWVLVVAVLQGMLAFGAPPRQSLASATEPWKSLLESLLPLATLQSAIVLALGLLLVTGCLRSGRASLLGGAAARSARLPLLLLLALGLLHALPLPAALLRIVAPHSAQVWADLAPTGDSAMRPLTLWSDGTFHALYTLAGVLVASSLLWALIGERRVASDGGEDRLRPVVGLFWLILGVAAAESAYGLYETLLGDDAILGFGKVSNGGSVTGTFIHRTMLAVWAGMGLCVGLGLAARALLGGERRLGVATAALALAAVCGIAAGLSQSRLGLVAVAAGCAVTVLALLPTASRRGGPRVVAGFLLLASVTAVVAGALVWSSEAFQTRLGYLFGQGGLSDPRFAAWRSTLDLFGRAPLTGTGIGSFGRAVHLTQSVDATEELWFAHSDPLNLLSDAGLIGFALGAWWLVGLIRRGLPALRSDQAGVAMCAASAFGAAAVVLTASLGDFQTQFPVVALPFAALLIAPAALAAMRDEEPARRPWPVPAAVLAGGLALVLAGLAVLPPARALARRSRAGGESVEATEAERLVAQAKRTMGSLSKLDGATAHTQLEGAVVDLREATRLDPLLAEAHLFLGLAGLYVEDDRDEVLRSLGRARLVSRGHAAVNLTIGKTYLSLFGTGPAPYGPDDDSALEALREAGALDPDAFAVAWELCAGAGYGEEAMKAIVPPRAHAYVRLGRYVFSRKPVLESLEPFIRALELEPWHTPAAVRLAKGYVQLGREATGRERFLALGVDWPLEGRPR